jgi:hypothetical protein
VVSSLAGVFNALCGFNSTAQKRVWIDDYDLFEVVDGKLAPIPIPDRWKKV